MKTCLFCEKPAGSEEHIIPQWLTKYLGIGNTQIIPTRFSEDKGFKRKNPVNFGKFTTDTVCRDCNNGWMAQLESWLSKEVKPYFAESWEPETDLPEIQNLRPQLDTLKKWMLKTAITFQQILPESDLEEVDHSIYPAAKGAIPLKDHYILAAHIIEPAVVLGLRKGFPTWNGGYKPYQINKKSADFIIQINKLALRLLITPRAHPGWVGHHKMTKEGKTIYCMPLHLDYPQINPAPFEVAHVFPSLDAFQQSTEIYVEESPKK